jgi:hypothetical protein
MCTHLCLYIYFFHDDHIKRERMKSSFLLLRVWKSYYFCYYWWSGLLIYKHTSTSVAAEIVVDKVACKLELYLYTNKIVICLEFIMSNFWTVNELFQCCCYSCSNSQTSFASISFIAFEAFQSKLVLIVFCTTLLCRNHSNLIMNHSLLHTLGFFLIKFNFTLFFEVYHTVYRLLAIENLMMNWFFTLY